MNCPVCGAELPEGALVCGECGARIAAPEVPEVPAAPVPEEIAPVPEEAAPAPQPVPVFTPPVREPVPTYEQPQPEAAPAVNPAREDAEKLTPLQSLAFMKIMAIACYALGLPAIILSFIFLREKKYVMSHANNGLLITIFGAALATISWIPILGWLSAIVVGIFLVVMEIMGIIAAAKGQTFTMPIIGGIRILKPVE